MGEEKHEGMRPGAKKEGFMHRITLHLRKKKK